MSTKRFVIALVGIVSLTTLVLCARNYTTNEIIGIDAGIIAFSAYVRYIISIIKKETVPSPTTWIILAVLGIILSEAFNKVGAGHAIWFAWVNAALPIIIALLSLWFGKTKIERIDVVCGVGAIVIGVLWWVFHIDPFFALICVILLDGVGMCPTIKKSYTTPQEEDLLAWSLSFIAAVINLYAVEEWTGESLAYPYYVVGACGVVVILLTLRTTKQKPAALS